MPDPERTPEAAIAIAATFTVEPLLPPLRFVLNEAGLALGLECAPYNQVFQELLSNSSLLASNAGGVNVILIRIEDFARESSHADAARLVTRTTQELSDALSQFSRRAKSPTLLTVFARSPRAPAALESDLDAAAATLVEHARALSGMHLVTPEAVDGFSTGERYDLLRDELAHIPFTEEYYGSIALALGRKVHALRVPAHKVLVLDCDNTLWRGVVGEDGVEGIAIPNAFQSVQRFAVERQLQGILVCLASKNSERDVLDVFDKRSDMVLKRENVVAHRINWQAKSDNLMSLARELNLGLDSFVFLDDNPIECAQMRAALPQVVTLQLPVEGEIETFLERLWVFDKVAVTKEDMRRTSLYRENAARQLQEESAADIGDFIASLELQIDISSPQENEWPRVAQLTQRTNQFNFTTLRRTEPEIRAAQLSGSLILRVNVKDRFGDYGLVGLMVANSANDSLLVDTLLLSCRVLGRGVEHAMLRRLGEVAIKRNLSQVELLYVPTAKNEPACAFAESVVGDFKIEDQNKIVYRIPAVFSSGITHRPGFDPEEVINARKSEEKKTIASGPSLATSITTSRSDRYSRLAEEFASGSAIINAMRAKDARLRSLSNPLERPASDTERRLVVLWQELLNMDDIGVEDDYFSLGGTSLLAARMFAEIAQRFGVKLRLTAILEAPTIRALARYIEPEGIERSGNLVPLKHGRGRNFFLVHDGDGETLLYCNLARRMPDNVAVFGIEPRRMPKVPLAHTRIEDMARFYIEEVRKKQPTGPYMLGGLCAGGVIAYEMASQLRSAGQLVSLVAILDAAKPHALQRPGRLSSQRVERLKLMLSGTAQERKSIFLRGYQLIGAASKKLAGFLSWQLSSRLRRVSTRIRFRVLREVLSRGLAWPAFIAELSVREIYDSAEAQYFPKALPESGALLARAQAGELGDTPYREIFSDDTFGWTSVAPEISVIDVKGGHSSMLQEPFVESLASALARRVKDDAEPFRANTVSQSTLEQMAT
jgi:FkbH-like protein